MNDKIGENNIERFIGKGYGRTVCDEETHTRFFSMLSQLYHIRIHIYTYDLFGSELEEAYCVLTISASEIQNIFSKYAD